MDREEARRKEFAEALISPLKTPLDYQSIAKKILQVDLDENNNLL